MNLEIKDRLRKPVRVMQLIVAALLMGIVSFGVVVMMMRRMSESVAAPPAEPQGGLLGYTALAVGIAALLGIPFLAKMLTTTGRRAIGRGASPVVQAAGLSMSPADPFVQTDEGRLFQLLFTKTIVTAALLEGAALINLVACMLAFWLPNLLMIVLLAVAVVAQVPTMDRVETWIVRQLRHVQNDRRLHRNA